MDHLQVLRGLDSDDLRPLRERKRALKTSKGTSQALVEALVTCGALLVSEDVPCCPSCELPDALARALAYALQDASRTSQVVTAVAARDHLIQVLRMEMQGGVRWLAETGRNRGEIHHPCRSAQVGMGDAQAFLERTAFPSKQVTVSKFGHVDKR